MMDYLKMNKDYQYYKTEDFLLDDLFIEWLLSPNENNIRYWNNEISNLLTTCPSKENEIKMAISIFNSCHNLSDEIQYEDLDILWNRIRLSTLGNF